MTVIFFQGLGRDGAVAKALHVELAKLDPVFAGRTLLFGGAIKQGAGRGLLVVGLLDLVNGNVRGEVRGVEIERLLGVLQAEVGFPKVLGV